jgi:N-acetylneuraminate synthase/N,N'-diacetyllegionaminate synthase
VGLNGAAYVASPEFLRRHRRFVVEGLTRPSLMDAARGIDIDTEDHLVACEGMLRARRPGNFAIGAREIGPPHPCYVIAEAGVNHNGDVSLAHSLVDAAAETGADAVKFQTFDPGRLVSERAPKAEYQKQTTGTAESQKTMLEALVLSRPAHRELAAHARERGLQFLSSPFDEESADFLMELDLPAFKIPSGEVTNLPLLRHIARFGRPLLVSTGMCEMAEVSEAMDAIRIAGDPPVALLHCVSNYPADPRSANLRAMPSLAAAFGVPVGWSDHTMGIDIALAAVALDACVLEKHLTVSRSLPGPDHRASLEPQEFARLVRGVRAVELARGDGIKRPQDEELGTREVARKSLHWTRALAKGHCVDLTDLICLRPGHGVPPGRLDQVVGCRLLRDVEEGAMVGEADIDAGRPS